MIDQCSLNHKMTTTSAASLTVHCAASFAANHDVHGGPKCTTQSFRFHALKFLHVELFFQARRTVVLVLCWFSLLLLAWEFQGYIGNVWSTVLGVRENRVVALIRNVSINSVGFLAV